MKKLAIGLIILGFILGFFSSYALTQKKSVIIYNNTTIFNNTEFAQEDVDILMGILEISQKTNNSKTLIDLLDRQHYRTKLIPCLKKIDSMENRIPYEIVQIFIDIDPATGRLINWTDYHENYFPVSIV